ncbi:hypothetical protein GGF32_002273 [Allomyces javanicus]|nr:hypothetical protein GGF32_002273 [Allomyces javanicus]
MSTTRPRLSAFRTAAALLAFAAAAIELSSLPSAVTAAAAAAPASVVQLTSSITSATTITPAAAAPPLIDLTVAFPPPWPVQFLVDVVGLQTLPAHWHILLGSAVACQVLLLLSRYLSPLVAPVSYRGLSSKRKLDWDVHVVSSVHALTIVSLAWPQLFDPVLVANPVFGYTHQAGTTYAICCGYFLWDALFSLVHVQTFGIGFLVHGIACLAVYLLSFRPFLLYYGSVFLMFELSTPFLNLHWFMDKTGMTGTTIQLVNGIVFLATFFLARICFGFYSSYQFFVSVIAVLDQLPMALFLVYAVANVVLNTLNLYWFHAMIQSLRRRFASSQVRLDSPVLDEKPSRGLTKSESTDSLVHQQ